MMKKYKFKPIELRLERIRQGMSLGDMAKKAGLNYNTISQVETGKTSPILDTVLKMAGCLNMSISDLIEVVENENTI